MDNNSFSITFKDTQPIRFSKEIKKIHQIIIVKYDEILIRELAEIIKSKKPRKLICLEGNNIENSVLKNIPLDSFNTITLDAANNTFTSSDIQFQKLKLYTTSYNLVRTLLSCKSIRHLVIAGFIGNNTGFFNTHGKLKDIHILEFKHSWDTLCKSILRYVGSIDTIIFHLQISTLIKLSPFSIFFANKVKRLVFYIKKNATIECIQLITISCELPIETITIIDDRKGGFVEIDINIHINELIVYGESYQIIAGNKTISRQASNETYTFQGFKVIEKERTEKTLKKSFYL